MQLLDFPHGRSKPEILRHPSVACKAIGNDLAIALGGCRTCRALDSLRGVSVLASLELYSSTERFYQFAMQEEIL